jgi:hypothetical protein
MGDLFAPLLILKQRLPDLKKLAQPAAAGPEETISLAAQAEDEEPAEQKPKVSRRRPVARVVKKSAKQPQGRKTKRRI